MTKRGAYRRVLAIVRRFWGRLQCWAGEHDLVGTGQTVKVSCLLHRLDGQTFKVERRAHTSQCTRCGLMRISALARGLEGVKVKTKGSQPAKPHGTRPPP